jgi:hypothetical protein
VLRTLKSVLKHWQAAQKTERKSESVIAMCDRMQMYNIMDLFPSTGEGSEAPTLLGPWERPNLNHWSESLDWNVVFSSI